MIKFKTNKNKKAKAFTVKGAAALIIAALAAPIALFGMTGCPNNAGGGGSPPNVGSVEDTGDGFIKITPPANGIVGVAPNYALPGSEAWWKGVFIKDRKVKLSPYKLGKTEVTYKLWKEVYDWATGHGYTFANPGVKGKDGSGTDDEPVTTISWRDCIVWCNAYTQMKAEGKADTECVYRKKDDHTVVLKDATATADCDAAYAEMGKKGFRLPTDAAETGAVAWYSGNSGGKTHPVGERRANALGLHDMSGNVWEWCFDWYDDIEANTVTDPQGGASGSYRVLRGGSWYFYARYCTVGVRGYYSPDYWSFYLGFRLACRP